MSDKKKAETPSLEKDAVDESKELEIEENSEPENDSTDEDTGNESELIKEEDDLAEVTEDIQEDEPADNEETDKDNQQNRSAKKDKIVKTLKWAGIISLPLITATFLFFLKPTFITNIFNKPEQLVYTPKTAAIKWTAEELEMINIVGQTLAETEKIWNNIFTQKGGIYKKPDFTIFTNRISSVCVDDNSERQDTEKIIEQSFIGTFYCPEEKCIYIDLSLHLDLKNRLDIPGDFAQGYIVAHEIGHHVQNLAGISEQVPAARLTLGEKEFDMVLQRMELQADCFAGIWARHTAERLYNTSREEFVDALDAVTHYSREHLKQKEDNDMMPDPFTHSSSRLRLRWFTIGYDKGTFDACDTFTIMEL